MTHSEDQTKPARKQTKPSLSADALLAPLRGNAGFVGRKEELRRISQMLTTTSDMVLLVKGEPGIGKTTLINRVKTLLDDQVAGSRDFRYFSIEPSSLVSLENFARDLWRGMLTCVDSPSIAEEAFSIETFYGFGADLEVLRKAAGDTTFVVFLDEFDEIYRNMNRTEIERAGIRGLINYLVVSIDVPIVFFFSVLQDLPQHYGSTVPTLPLTLHVLTLDETTEVAHGILAGYFVLDDAEIAWLYEYCGGHPYLTRLLLAKLLEQLQLGIPSQPPLSSVWEDAAQAAVESGRAKELLGSLYESDLNDDQRYILLWFAANRVDLIMPDQVAQLGWRLRTALRELSIREYLTREVNGSYCLRIRLLRDWLAHEWARFQSEAERLGISQVLHDRSGGELGEPPPQIP